MNFTTLLATAAYVPNTPGWSPLVGVVMIVCNVLAIVIARSVPSAKLTAAGDTSFAGLALPNLIAAAAFGHVLGAGAILGLANAGVL